MTPHFAKAKDLNDQTVWININYIVTVRPAGNDLLDVFLRGEGQCTMKKSTLKDALMDAKMGRNSGITG